MGLVEHDQVVVGQHVPAAGEVGAVEVAVDDHHRGLLGPLAGPLGEALRAGGAADRAGAVRRRGAELGPHPGRRLEAEVGPVAARRSARPTDHRAQLGPDRARVADRVELEAVVAGDLARLLHAQVVAAALQHREVDVDPEMLGKQGQVLGGQLVLQRLGGGRHDALRPRQERGDEVGQRLACSGPGLDDQMASGRDRGRHRLGHVDLSGARLAAAR